MTADLGDLGIRLRSSKPGEHRTACPECARTKSRPRDDALAVRIDHDGSATWLCHRCGWKGSTQRQEGPPGRDRSRPRPTPPPEPASRPSGLPDAAVGLWRSCRPVEPSTIAAAYLEHRGVALPHPEGDLRWYPSLRHPSGHVGPALVALVTDAVTAEAMTLHRTWIAPDGKGKAAIDKPRLLWPGAPKAGGAVRLWPDAEVTIGLAVGEGIETSLALARGFGVAWACVDAGNLATLPVLDGIDAITIAADHDEAGIRAAHACAERWAQVGRQVRIVLPDVPGADLADEAAA